MKKIVAFLTIVLTLVSLMSACGTKEAENYANGFFEYAFYGVGVEEMLQLEWTGVEEGETLNFSSSDTNIAFVNSYGVVVGISEGVVTVTAKSEKHGFSCIVEVNNGQYAELTGKETFIKWEGRNFTYNNMVNCFNTASGFEALFYGTSFNAEIVAGAKGGVVKLCVMVDDLHTPMDNNIEVKADKKVHTYELAKNLSEGYHRIRVYKITEATESSVAFKSVQTDGYFWARPKNKQYKIEVYGDSITVGMNNMREEENDVSAPQNGCMTYCWLAAEKLDADINVFARSGIGMNWSWGDEIYMKSQYKYTYCSESNFLDVETNPLWDFKSYVPDVVVINLGTNDTYCDAGFDEKAYIEEMRKLCQNLLNEYGAKTKILLCAGITATEHMPSLMKLAEENENIEFVQLPSTPGHPNKEHHKTIAEVLAKKLIDILP